MYRFWVSVLGTGYSPFAPGTCGSAVVTLIFLLAAFFTGSAWTVAAVMLVVAALGFIATVVHGPRAIARYGHDPGVITSDEQCGQALTYLWIWSAADHRQWLVLALTGFVLFRLFDIVKPPPARQLERVKGAWGVLLDDVMAGIYAHIALQIIWHAGWLQALAAR